MRGISGEGVVVVSSARLGIMPCLNTGGEYDCLVEVITIFFKPLRCFTGSRYLPFWWIGESFNDVQCTALEQDMTMLYDSMLFSIFKLCYIMALIYERILRELN